MAKKIFLSSAIIMLALVAGAWAADCGKKIVGKWSFDMGGVVGLVEYKADGKLVQDMAGMKVDGTYTVKGNKLTTVVSGTNTVFTLQSCNDASITIKRDKDGKTLVYKKK